MEDLLSVVSLLSVDSVLFTPQDRREEAAAVRQKFTSPDGDHLTLLNIFRAYRAVRGNKVREGGGGGGDQGGHPPPPPAAVW